MSIEQEHLPPRRPPPLPPPRDRQPTSAAINSPSSDLDNSNKTDSSSLSHDSSSDTEGGNVIVRVRAQVMNRDDSKGGWVPKGKGGFANVSVRKRKIQHEDSHCRYEYQIFGRADKETVLNCPIKKDFVYHKVMPAFHHWQSDNLKLGLTFQTASDARTFDQGIQLAMGDLFEGLSSSVNNSQQFSSNTIVDEEVFMQLDLPVEKGATTSSESPLPNTLSPTRRTVTTSQHEALSRLGSTSPPNSGDSGNSPCPLGNQEQQEQHQSKQRLDREIRLLLQTIDADSVKKKGKEEDSEAFNKRDKEYSYVKFPPRPMVHEYSYPTLFEEKKSNNKESAKKLSQKQANARYSSNKSVATKSVGGGKMSSTNTASPLLPIRKSTSGFLQQSTTKSSWLFGGFGTNSSTTNSSSSSPPNTSEGGSLDHQYARKKAMLLSGSSPPKRGMSPPEYFPDSLRGDMMSNADVGSSLFSGLGGKPHCVHCRESFSLSENRRGACDEAPDAGKRALDWITGVRCAEGILYHCTSDSEGDYVHPCKCSNRDGHCAVRWCGITLLSILIPCLCLYPPLLACYTCGRACSLCGGRHQAA